MHLIGDVIVSTFNPARTEQYTYLIIIWTFVCDHLANASPIFEMGLIRVVTVNSLGVSHKTKNIELRDTKKRSLELRGTGEL